MNASKTELIQVQSNRFIHNWRKGEGVEPYPHYEPIREKFRGEVAVLERFLKDEELGALALNQCEVTYINHIEPSEVWHYHGELEKVFAMWSGLKNAAFLPNPEDAGLQVRFPITNDTGKLVGRLNVIIQPAWKKTDNSPILAMNLTARGTPLADNVDGAFAFLDLGREWIVKAFADLTTAGMQRAWERING